MYPHRIRLRGPWECQPLVRLVRGADGRVEEVAGPVPEPRRVIMPSGWNETGLQDFMGRVRFRRRFGYPGRIDAHERVWLTFAGIEGAAEIRLNGNSLGPHAGARLEFDITSLLAERNVLEVTMTVEPNSSLWGEAALEIRLASDSEGEG